MKSKSNLMYYQLKIMPSMKRWNKTWLISGRKSIGSISKPKLKQNSISPLPQPLLIPQLLEKYLTNKPDMQRISGK